MPGKANTINHKEENTGMEIKGKVHYKVEIILTTDSHGNSIYERLAEITPTGSAYGDFLKEHRMEVFLDSLGKMEVFKWLMAYGTDGETGSLADGLTREETETLLLGHDLHQTVSRNVRFSLGIKIRFRMNNRIYQSRIKACLLYTSRCV